MHTAEAHSVPTVTLIDSSCTYRVYGPVPNGAVSDTMQPQPDTSVLSQHSWAAEEQAPCKCCGVRSRTSENSSIRYSQGNGRCSRHLENHMLIVGAVIVLIAVVIIPRMRVPGSGSRSTLGWMSEQWLAEHRAAHSA